MFYALTGVWILAVIAAVHVNSHPEIGAKAYVKGQSVIEELKRRVVGE